MHFRRNLRTNRYQVKTPFPGYVQFSNPVMNTASNLHRGGSNAHVQDDEDSLTNAELMDLEVSLEELVRGEAMVIPRAASDEEFLKKLSD